MDDASFCDSMRTDFTSDGLPCPLCGKGWVIVMMCGDCWDATRPGLTEEQYAKLVMFERYAPMSPGHRATFDELKSRRGLV